MEYIIIIFSSIIIISILICVIIVIGKKNKKLSIQLNQKLEEIIQQNKSKISDACAHEQTQLSSLKQEYNSMDARLKERQRSLQEFNAHLDEQRADAEKRNAQICEETFKGLYNLTKAEYQHQITTVLEELQKATYEEYEAERDSLQSVLQKLQQRVTEALSEVNEWEAKRDAINEDILREKKKQEQQEFYKVSLSNDAIEDINVLLEAKKHLHLSHNLDKLIYDGYISKPVVEMIKRVLNGRAPSGIYKITRLLTGEVYIGKSTDIKNRWGEHCKSCFNVGTIAHSTLHTTMQKDGIQNFTFELIEECPKDQLTEREKFYINLYNSKNYGLNEKVG